MSDLLKKFAETTPPETWRDVHVGVALSGGPDSVALLRAALEIKSETGGKGQVFALHVNHKLRGDESEGDAAWCKELCHQRGVFLQVAEGDVAARAAVDGDGIEAAARQERYRLLTEMAEARGARFLFFGHTRDDQVETVLFRILRGTGIRGLSGIAGSRALTPSLTLLRPLLACTREEVIAFLNTCGQDSRFDSSNSSGQFARNRIRSELLPLLRENYNAGVDDALARLAEQAGELQVHVEARARDVLQQACEWQSPQGFAINVVRLREHLLQCNSTAGQASGGTQNCDNSSTFVVIEVLRLAWREAGLPEQAMTREWWTELAKLTREDASDIVLNLPGNMRVEFASGLLRVKRAEDRARDEPAR